MHFCVSCNEPQPANAKICNCGHVLTDSFSADNRRRRKRPYRPNSVSSDWIIDEKSKLKTENGDVNPTKRLLLKNRKTNNNNISQREKSIKGRRPSNTIDKNNNIDLNNNNLTIKDENNNCIRKPDDKGLKSIKVNKTKTKEERKLLKEDQPYRNIFFHMCRSYKVHPTIGDFNFDFSRFNMRVPAYPLALDDINEKVARVQRFKIQSA